MNNLHYTINNRNYSMLLSSSKDLELQAEHNYLFDLSHLSLLDVTGERAADFLQGQFTCNVQEINQTTMRPGALCNLKGRILALADIIQWQNYRLILPTDLALATLSSLSKTAMLSRVELKEHHDFQCLGLYINNTEDERLPFTLPSSPFSACFTSEYYCYALDEKSYIIVSKKNEASELIQRFAKADCLRGSLAWHRLQLAACRCQIYPETRGLFLPHRLDLHLKQYISFNKGCYKGQEIIARMHYLAKQKHQVKPFGIVSKKTPILGEKLRNAKGQEIGELIDFCPLSPEHYLIVASVLIEHPHLIYLEGQEASIELTSL